MTSLRNEVDGRLYSPPLTLDGRESPTRGPQQSVGELKHRFREKGGLSGTRSVAPLGNWQATRWGDVVSVLDRSPPYLIIGFEMIHGCLPQILVVAADKPRYDRPPSR